MATGESTGDCAAEFSFWIKGSGAFQKIVAWIAIDQGTCADYDQAFFRISDEDVGINHRDLLLFVFRKARSKWIDAERAGKNDRGGVARADKSALTERRDWGGDDAFGKTFL